MARPPSPTKRWWLALAVASGAAYLTLYWHPSLFWYLGIQHYEIWFADTYALLASSDAVTQGLNPSAPNPLDYFSRPHVYSHWWLGLRHLGLTRDDISWLGPSLVGAVWAAALVHLRPRTWRQMVYALAVMLASPMLLALERANNDLVIFLLLAPLARCLLSVRLWIRLLAPFLVVAAAGLKYYPAAAGVTLLAFAPAPELRWRLAIAGVLAALVGWSVAPDLAIFGALAPKPTGWMTFGATSAFTTLGWTGTGPRVVGLLAGILLVVWAWRSTQLRDWTPRPESSFRWLRFVTGAAILTGCFFASANFAYRWIFAVWTAPFLWELGTDPSAPPHGRRLARVTSVLLLAALWLDTVFSWVAIAGIGILNPATIQAWVKYSFLLEQPVTWALFACLMLFVARFVKMTMKIQPANALTESSSRAACDNE